MASSSTPSTCASARPAPTRWTASSPGPLRRPSSLCTCRPSPGSPCSSASWNFSTLRSTPSPTTWRRSTWAKLQSLCK
uniref:Uncharacterized protein n=1 Tax=Anguilla anguilla TaxID=7936 RepID=A0A0E9RRR2_ANGAN